MMAAVLAFLRLSRLRFLIGGFLGVAFGTLVARYQGFTFDPHATYLVQIAVTSFQLMTHYTNDYFDRESDAQTVRTPFSGGSGVFARNELAPRVALFAAVICLATGAAAVTFLGLRAHAVAFWIGIVIAILAWSYSSPPLRLLARGVGEFTTAIVVAVLVPLFAFSAQAGTIDAAAVASTLPAALAMFIMMICVQIPDIAADAATGKRNLVVRFGLASARNTIAIATIALFLSGDVAWIAGAPWTLEGAAVLPLPLCLMLLAGLRPARPRPPEWIARSGVLIFVCSAAAGVAAYLV